MSSIPSPEAVWSRSTVTEKDLQKMVTDLVLPEKNLIGWHATIDESFPATNTDEIIIFEHFIYRGFSVLTNSFFRGLLHWYGIELVNLNLNSILHISTFIHLCEVYLGVRSHFNLFHYLFTLKPNQKGGKISVVGGTGLQLRQGRGNG